MVISRLDGAKPPKVAPYSIQFLVDQRRYARKLFSYVFPFHNILELVDYKYHIRFEV